MRKDLRIGLGIGGVLLAVLIVSLVVRSNNNSKQAEQQALNLEAGEGDGQNPNGEDPAALPDGAAGETGGPVMPPLPPVAGDPAGGPAAGGAIAGGATAGGAPEPDVFAPPAPPASTPPATPGDWNLILARERSENPAPGTPRTRAPHRGYDAPAPADSSAADSARVARADTAGTERIGSSLFNGTRTPGERNYVVKSGETLISIARAHYGNSRHYRHIMKANPNVDPESMKPGTRLVLPDLSSLPAPRRTGNGGTAFEAATEGANAGLRPVDPKMEYRIQSGDSLARISQRLYGTEAKVDALYNANRETIGPDREKLKLGVVLRLPEPPTATASR